MFQVFPSNEGLLVIKEDGSCVYTSDSAPGLTLTSDPARDTASQRRSPRDQPGSYLMSHTADILCEVVDPDGNLFQVRQPGSRIDEQELGLCDTWSLHHAGLVWSGCVCVCVQVMVDGQCPVVISSPVDTSVEEEKESQEEERELTDRVIGRKQHLPR